MGYSKKIKSPLARVAFTNGLVKPQSNQEGTKKSWNCALLFPKTSDISALLGIVREAAVDEWGDKAGEWLKSGLVKSPIIDGDGKSGLNKKTGEPWEGFPGNYLVRVQSGEDHVPQLLGKDMLPLQRRSEIYSGCYVYVVVNAYTYDHPKNGKGVSIGFSIVQFAKDGDRLGGGGSDNPEDFLEKISDEGSAPAETKSGQGAGGLFG